MPRNKVGFFKKEQGVFTQEVIARIQAKLSRLPQVELIAGLDYTRAYAVNGTVYIDDFDLSELDVYFWHDTVWPAVWKADDYYLNVFKALEDKCSFVNSPTSIATVNDKYLAHQKLREQGLPVADFALVGSENKAALARVLESFGGRALIKPRFGGWGIGIKKVESLDDLYDTAELLGGFLGHGEQLLLERYYPNDLERWVSVVVFGDRVLFGYRKRLLGDSTWKIYDPDKIDGKGKYTEYVDPPQELKEISLAAKDVIGKDIIGFDFIFTEEGYKIVDENGRPGLYARCLAAAGIDIEAEVVDLIKSKMRT